MLFVPRSTSHPLQYHRYSKYLRTRNVQELAKLIKKYYPDLSNCALPGLRQKKWWSTSCQNLNVENSRIIVREVCIY